MEWRTVALTVLVVSLCFLAIPIRVEPDTNNEDVKLFQNYVTRYNKSYKNNPTEYEEKFKRFQRSLRHIEKMNDLRSSQESAYYGVTQYSDMTENEFLAQALVPDLPVRGEKHVNAPYHRLHHSQKSTNRVKRSAGIPSRFDWRDKGVVTAVRSQGSCGACWAFSTVEVIETMYALKNGTLKMDQAFGVRIKSFACDSFVDAEDELLTTVATHGPVAAAVNALSWQNYLGGVIQYNCDGAFESLNHAVQIVGYDQTADIPHYIIKNSWGTNFGDKGYMYIGIGSNLCGIANQVSSLDVL
ncbi:Cathepsin O [Habropoda laboriosa]|uniref:Cathepsin O n=1 Tax=Habropoda laboriosa TaxID=597456 RepID=A0A0L7R8D3_9HYME|nr:Cathepsin O [Habropoda laboriosa]